MIRTRRDFMLVVAGAAATVLIAAAIGLIVLYSGAYSVAATEQHTAPVYSILEIGMHRSVRARLADIRAPELDDPAMIRAGLACYHRHCVQCHGAPGVPPDDVGKGLQPAPNNLAQTARDWPPEALYWTTKNGIRMAGMPAWQFRMSEEALWGTVAFLERLPGLSAVEYRQLVSGIDDATCERADEREEGAIALRQYACITCHKIPGLTGPDVHVGPPLEQIARRAYIAGVLPNTTENLVRWIRDPQAVRPNTLMPDLDVTDAHARAMVAYLQTLE
jgi:mono/diheme cytochrome c family protein/cytochrome c2